MKTVGVLITNLGTPSAPTASAVRHYLAEFLSDPRVIELPQWLWRPILHSLVLPLRAHRSAINYQKIWLPEGSPLLVNSKKLTNQLQHYLQNEGGDTIKITLGMRYGTPSINAGLNELIKNNIKQILVLPLYPQYSAAATESAFDAVAKTLRNHRSAPEIRTVTNYAEDSDYINAIAESIKHHWKQQGKAQKLLFSFHGLPKKRITSGDPYQDQCFKTANRVAEKLALKNEDFEIVFQSRFGREQWLEPYCDKTLQSLPMQGIKSVDVICPGFSVDCLETLEEIAIQNKSLFKHAGGEQFSYIPALNDSPLHVNALGKLIIRNIKDWLT